MFAELPRDVPVSPHDADVVVRRLKQEGFLRPRSHQWRWPLLAAAAMVLFAAGVITGRTIARRGSLEDMLARPRLTIDDRVLLLQRAGSAYVVAAQSYANATAHVDSTAVEVASKVLLGAANAVARSSLDAGLSARLATVFQPSTATPDPVSRKPVIWF
jgi:hypothetical protein